MPATINARALIAAGVGARLLVWDEEINGTVPGRLISYEPSGWPMFVVEVTEEYPTLRGGGMVRETTRVGMQQGPYTDSGRYRVVSVVAQQPMEQLMASAGVLGWMLPNDQRELVAFLDGARRAMDELLPHCGTTPGDRLAWQRVREAVASMRQRFADTLSASEGETIDDRDAQINRTSDNATELGAWQAVTCPRCHATTGQPCVDAAQRPLVGGVHGPRYNHFRVVVDS